MIRIPASVLALVLVVVASAALRAQTHRDRPPRLPLSFDRYHDHAEIGAIMRRMVETWPDFLELTSIGTSHEGRELWMMTVRNPATGPDAHKAAMYIDANVHGNEIQGSEVCLYTIWFLMENHGVNDTVTRVVDERVLYVVPSVNPDGRDRWLKQGATPHSSRSGVMPVDDDRDGLFDEDPPNDLDGDGSITTMRKRVERGGTHEIDPDDPRFLRRVPPDREGDWVILGGEGIDDDGDGQIDEDDVGGYDMNRNNPTDWQPTWIQRGAGAYPFSQPEVRAVGEFLLAHPHVAAVQSYHNSGGMILRGPGAATVPEYPREDLAVYDELARDGEAILPWYRYMILHRDLYTVHGGFVNFAAEGLGVVSFTNELWSDSEYFQRGRGEQDARRFNDLVVLGGHHRDWTPYDHPRYGPIEIGGWTKWSRRVNPAFTLPETCHRNAAFTIRHADAMPKVAIEDARAEALGEGVHRVRVVLRNERLIPSRTKLAAERRIGLPDFVTIEGGEVLAAGIVRGRAPDERVTPIEHDLARVRLEDGVPGRGRVEVEWIVRSAPPFAITYASEKGGRAAATIE